MAKWFSAILILALAGGSGITVRAADESPGTPAAREEKTKEARKTNGAPAREEREKKREQFKNMTPEEREAKRKELKERLEKRIAELRAQQTNATLTPQESRELDRREQILKRFEQNTPGAPRIEPSKPVFTK